MNCEHSLPLWFCPQRDRDFRDPQGHYYVGFSFVASVKQLSAGVQNDWIASLLSHVGLCQISPPWLCASRGQPGQPAYKNTTTPHLFSFSNKEGCYNQKKMCFSCVCSFQSEESLTGPIQFKWYWLSSFMYKCSQQFMLYVCELAESVQNFKNMSICVKTICSPYFCSTQSLRSDLIFQTVHCPHTRAQFQLTQTAGKFCQVYSICLEPKSRDFKVFIIGCCQREKGMQCLCLCLRKQNIQ